MYVDLIYLHLHASLLHCFISFHSFYLLFHDQKFQFRLLESETAKHLATIPYKAFRICVWNFVKMQKKRTLPSVNDYSLAALSTEIADKNVLTNSNQNSRVPFLTCINLRYNGFNFSWRNIGTYMYVYKILCMYVYVYVQVQLQHICSAYR